MHARESLAIPTPTEVWLSKILRTSTHVHQEDPDIQEVPNPAGATRNVQPKPFEFHTCLSEVVIELDDAMWSFVLSSLQARGGSMA